jgi:hypothetical protein
MTDQIMTDTATTHKAEKYPSKFDWVTERSSCALPKVFKALMLQVEEDIKTRNALRPNNSPYEFSVAEHGDDFSVLLKAKDVNQSVVFTLAEHAIVVSDDKGDPMFDVTATFSDEGECRLKVNGEERDLWQVRRMALEDLLFRGF